MLSLDENERLTAVGAATPMGEVIRRYWLPFLEAKDLSGPDGEPVRVKLLGEELVAFKDTHGRMGLIEMHCAHRLADLLRLLAIDAACQQAEPLGEEGAVGGRVFELQRVQPRRLAGTQPVVRAADRADEQFRPAILVEEDRTRAEPPCLGEKEIQHHCLARSRWADGPMESPWM